MCIACEIAFYEMLEALSPEERARVLREQDERARFACDAPDDEPLRPATPQNADERKP
jgi:hypothetical protein